MRTRLPAALVLLAGSSAFAQTPAMPTHGTDPEKCVWEWKQQELPDGGTLGVWAERCAFDTGDWELVWAADLPGFNLAVDGEPQFTVIQVFDKPAEAEPSAILPELRERGYIPDDDECILEPAADSVLATIGPSPRTQAFFEVRPTGARLAALEATPADEVPEPPCGEYGWSTHGVRYFMTDITHATRVIYVNLGQDGTMFDPRTIILE
jgi:hypothetical protein